MAQQALNIKLLKQFKPLDRFSEKQLILLQAHSELRRYAAGDLVLELGSEDKLEYFLLKGSVELESFDGRMKLIQAGTESARTAVALLQPRKYHVKAVSETVFVVVKQQTVETLLADLPQEKTVEFSVRDLHTGHEVEDIEKSFEHDLKTNNLSLPSFPDVAMRIKHLLEDPNVTARDIGDAVSSDPAIAVKLLKTSNSALYPSTQEITSCHDAVVRLGFQTTKQLVNIFAMKELFATDNLLLQQRMEQLWSHSREVACIAYVLAEITPRMNPEVALLAGLIHDVGAIPVLEYIERYPQFMKVDSRVDEIVNKLKAGIGIKMMEEWGFQHELIEVIKNSENWTYDSHGPSANYVDIVLVAQVHALIGKKAHEDLPPFSDIPAFTRLGESGLTPEQSQKVLLESHHRIADLKALLTMDTIPVVGE